MKASELRIGNWIGYDGWHPDLASNNRPMPSYDVVVKGIEYDEEKDCYIISSINERGFEDSFHPIILTEEWLERLGFKHITGDAIWREYKLSDYDEIWHCGNGYFIEKDSDTFKFYQHTDEDTYCQLKWIKYVHELQNLYYALTGKELILNGASHEIQK